MALHEQSVGKTDEWYTPKYVFDALGCIFDVDVAHPGLPKASWVPAKSFISSRSLLKKWNGFVWMNPPFGGRNGIIPWLNKFFDHGDGIALTPDRTSAPWWQDAAKKSDAIFFVSPKIKFIDINGNPGKSPAQGTTLMGCNAKAIYAFENAQKCGLGFFLKKHHA